MQSTFTSVFIEFSQHSSEESVMGIGASCLRSGESKVSKLINAQVKIHSHFKRESAAIPEDLPRTSSSSNLCNVKIGQKDLWTRPKAALYSKITTGLLVKDSL